MKYYFSDREKSAIVQVAIQMQNADGNDHINEYALNLAVFKSLNVKDENIDDAKSMSPLTAMEIIKNMTYEEKKFVCSYLATIMCADKEIDDKELTLWKFISTMCDLPTMHIAEALKYFMENHK
ncbi:MAG: hypothetical protein IJ998_03035 [Alistipes sp.]|nr:hypothetical protein [Alistipes sp.]